MARIEGLKKLVAALRDRAAKAMKDDHASVMVGFSAKYAIFVHENTQPKTLGLNVPRRSGLGVYWGPAHYGPKFLERPARELAPTLGKIAGAVKKKGGTLAQGLVAAGMRLERDSKENVPVEYGNLRASGFTELEG